MGRRHVERFYQEMSMIGKLQVMNRIGHTTVQWSTELQDTVDAANRTFNQLLDEGYTAYVMVDETRGEHTNEFDAAAATIMLVPRMVGG
jgi:hypothetical protein